MKNILNTTFIVLFATIIICPCLAWIFYGDVQLDKLDEKKDEITFPSFSVDYLSDIKEWFENNAPYRTTIISEYKKINQKYEAIYRKTVHVKLSSFLKPSWYSDEDYIAPLVDNDVIYGRGDWLFLEPDDTVEYYEGTNVLSSEEMRLWKDTFELLDDICNKKVLT